MIQYPASLKAVGGAHSGIAPANLLDVQDVDGNNYFWADRAMTALSVLTAAQATYLPWVLSVPSFTFHRSMATDMGSFILQNLSGDSLARDFEKILRKSTLEGAFFVYRLWQSDAEAAWLEVHGTLTVDEVGVDTVSLKGMQLLNPAQDDTPLENYCETCQLQWGGKRCGSAQTSECLYSFQSCQVVERIMVVMNDYEKNYGETTANSPMQVINRSRRI
jgi:hypothetical protein